MPVTWLGHQVPRVTATRTQETVFAWVMWPEETVDSANLATSTCSQAWAVRCKVWDMSVWLHVCLSVCMSISLSACLSVCQHVYQSVYLSVCMYVCLSVCLSAYRLNCINAALFFFSIGVTAIPLAPPLQYVIQSQDSACVEQVYWGCHVTLVEWDSSVSPLEAAEVLSVTKHTIVKTDFPF